MKFPEHKCGLYLTHNEHKDSYETAEDYIEQYKDRYDWESEDSKKKCIETDELWTLQWYPETPVGFCAIAAPTLKELIAFSNKGKIIK